MNLPHIRIDIHDVVQAGGVRQAIEEWCRESDETASGVIGPEFATSGPGIGWTKYFTTDDFAERAAEYGARYYIDSSDGRMMTIIRDPEGTPTIRDPEGTPVILSEWTPSSVVELICPDLDVAADHPKFFAEMAKSVVDHHFPHSNLKKWRELVTNIKELAEAIEYIDPSDFD